jgi:cytochrome P450
MLRTRSILAGLSAMHARLGSPFQIPLPGFHPTVLASPAHNRRLLVTHRRRFLWRTEGDPVTRLLRRGLLVEDGERHARLRALMEPHLQRSRAQAEIPAIRRAARRVTDTWLEGDTRDMLVEMRKIALLALMDALFGVDMTADLPRLWQPILKAIRYISPSAWIIWDRLPRPGYARPLRELDKYLHGLIRARRGASPPRDDLLSKLIADPALSDDDIRDQMLTLLIAGHDTSTALLAWALVLLGRHPAALARAAAEARAAADDQPRLPCLEAVIKETLRLYPPIHIGNRQAAEDMDVDGCPIPRGSRVMYSIYLTQRDPALWHSPDAFQPERFLAESRETVPAFAYLPFGGGPRNCIGAAFAQLEAKIILAHLLREFNLTLLPQAIHPHMGATLEPRPGVKMRITRVQP